MRVQGSAEVAGVPLSAVRGALPIGDDLHAALSDKLVIGCKLPSVRAMRMA